MFMTISLRARSDYSDNEQELEFWSSKRRRSVTMKRRGKSSRRTWTGRKRVRRERLATLVSGMVSGRLVSGMIGSVTSMVHDSRK